jgi:16S rRNA (guanine(966)-N(2))-methyltransferase RsmD
MLLSQQWFGSRKPLFSIIPLFCKIQPVKALIKLLAVAGRFVYINALMRIIAGSKRGMRLLGPKGNVSRPIIDRVKESLFSVLYQYGLPADAVVADLFCGVGSLGLESLSRGARFVTFIEKDLDIGAVLEKNIAHAGFEAQCCIRHMDAFSAGAPVDPGYGKYNLVFVDPPYAQSRDVACTSRLASLMSILLAQVTEEALVVVRTEKNIMLPDNFASFQLHQRHEWGTMAVSLLRSDKK